MNVVINVTITRLFFDPIFFTIHDSNYDMSSIETVIIKYTFPLYIIFLRHSSQATPVTNETKAIWFIHIYIYQTKTIH